MKASGVHVYVNSDDVVSTDKRFLAITASEAGTKRIALPQRATVRDFDSGRVRATDAAEFDVSMAQGETRLFVLDQED